MGGRLAIGLVLALLSFSPASVLADVPERARAHQKRAEVIAPADKPCLASGDDQTINALLSDGACPVVGCPARRLIPVGSVTDAMLACCVSSSWTPRWRFLRRAWNARLALPGI